MKRLVHLLRIFFSSTVSTLIILLFMVSQIVATLLPNQTDSWRYVYSTTWFEIIIWVLGINLLGSIIIHKTYKKPSIFILHLAMIIILIGAGVTRYAGFRGILHLRDNQTKSFIIIQNRANPSQIKIKNLGFLVKLDKFTIEKYPGSSQPSSYNSYITIKDKNKTFSYHIYMNHILTYKGYRFYQSGFDNDGRGSVLLVTHDPGMYITYTGYILLVLGFILVPFSKKTKFIRYIKSLNLSIIAFILLSLFSSNHNTYAFSLKNFSKNSKSVAKTFSYLLIQHNGRVEPIDTLDKMLINKLTGKSSLYGLNYNQLIVGMIGHPSFFEDLPMIRIKSQKIKNILKIKGNYASFNDFFSKNGTLKYTKEIEDAFRTPDSKRNPIQREWIRINELLYISSLIYSSNILTIFPLPNAKLYNYKWYPPLKIENLYKQKKLSLKEAIYYLKSYVLLMNGLKTLNVVKVKKAEKEIFAIQQKFSGSILPTKRKISLEILYNHLQIFKHLIPIYILLGTISIIFGFIEVLKRENLPKIKAILFAIGTLSILAHTLNMGLRWYISGHAPWSDAYESIVFIAFGSALASLLFFRKSLLSFGSGFLSAGLFMFVAHLDNINPQITNIVPVLNSYWLLIHVAFSIISYGFISVGAILGLINSILFIINRKKLEDKIAKLNHIIYVSSYIGLILLTVGTIFGAVWANESWGSYWSWDPKETWSLVSILVYAYLIHEGVLWKKTDELIFSILSFFSFFFILMTYFGVNFYIAEGLHSYGRGSAPPVWFYVMIAGIVMWFMIVLYQLLNQISNKYKTGTPNAKGSKNESGFC